MMMKRTCKFEIICVLCLVFFVPGIRFAKAQNLGKNIVTNGDFGKLPAGADANNYRQQYSNGVAPDEGEEFFVDYLSSGNFSQRKHQYVLAAKMNAFYSSWKNISASDGGLMMIVEGNAAWVNSSEKFYKRTFDLPSGTVYHFSLEVCNVWNQKGHGFLNALRIFDPWIAVNYNSENHKTNQIEYQNGWVKLEFDVVIPDEGKANFEFYVGHSAGGTGLGGDAWGTDFALDNIKLEPYLLEPGKIVPDGCQATVSGTVKLTSTVSGGPSGNETKYGRWMKRAKDGAWAWVDGVDIQSSGYSLEQDTATLCRNDYRILYSFSKSLLSSFSTPPTEESDYYAFSEIYEGKALPVLTLGTLDRVCKVGTELNSGKVQVFYPREVSEFSWQLDEGAVTTVACAGGTGSMEVDFEFGAENRAFKVVSYKVPEYCAEALPLTGMSVELTHIPNTVAGDINAENVVLCNGETGMLEAELARKVIRNPIFYWYDQADLSGTPLGSGLTLPIPLPLAEGGHSFYVTVQADNRCPSLPGMAKEVVVQVNKSAVATEIRVTGDFEVCEKVPLALTAAPAEGIDIINPYFEWYSDPDFAKGALLGTAPSYFGDSLQPGVQHLYVRMYADNRCGNLSGEGKAVEVKIIPRSIASDIAVAGDTRICREDMLDLQVSATTQPTVTNPEFRWYKDAGLTEPLTEGVTEAGAKYTETGLLPGQHIRYVTLAGDEVCENLPGQALGIPVAVLDSFVLPVMPVDTVRIFKDDDAVLFLDLQATGILEYEWYADKDLSGEVIGNAQTVTVRGLSEGVHSFYVRVKDESSCWSRSVEMPVRVYPPTNIRVDQISICQGEPGQLEVRTTLTDLTFSWSDSENGGTVLGQERVLALPGTLAVGEHIYYVEVTDNTTHLTTKQPAKVAVVPRAEIAGTAFEEVSTLCAGQKLVIPFGILSNALQYRVSLKSSTLEGFEFPAYTGTVTPELLAKGELEVAESDFPLTAEMGGADFVFTVEAIGEAVSHEGKVGYCTSAVEYAFSVRELPEIIVDEPEIVCAGGSLSLTPEVVLNGNNDLEYEWRMEGESGTERLQAGKVLSLSGVTKEWNGRQVWCCVRTECGWQESNRVALRVYDASFNTVSYTGGDVYAGMMAKIEGSVIPLNGLLYSWEFKTFWGEWTPLEGKNTASLHTSVDVTESFRRIVQAGECRSISNEVEVKVAEFNDSTAIEEGVGRFVYQETFGYVSQFEWAKENGDKRDISTYRKFDHTGGINVSKYSVNYYEMKAEDEWEESVNDEDRLPEKDPLLFYSGDWTFYETTTNLISEPWTKYKHNPAYVWCTDNMLIYNSRTEYVENGTYCAGNATCKQPVRWFNINGSWKMGYWYRYYYSGKSPSLDDGEYALTPCAYQMDPGALFVKYSKSPDHTVDPAGETGLMLIVNSKDTEVAYSKVISGLTGGLWYRFEAWVANPEVSGINSQANVKFEITGKGVVGEDGLPDPSVTSGALDRGSELAWKRCVVNFFVPEGVSQVKFSVSNVNGSGAGNVFVLDDMSVRELLVKNWTLAADFCAHPGELEFKLANEILFPEYAVVYSRLMQKEKGTELWQWAGEVSDSMKMPVAPERFINYDFRTVEAFSPSLLERIDPNDIAASNDLGYYAVTEKYEVPDFCLVLNGCQVDYVSVTDSIKILPDFTGLPEEATVYSRFLFRRFGTDSWEWLGKAAEEGTHFIPWTKMLEGDYKVVYAFSDGLLDVLDENGIVGRTAYYVSSEVLEGVRPVLTIVEKIANGQVTLKPEVEGLPMGALPLGCWMKRVKGEDGWNWLPMTSELSFTASLFEYSAGEYRFLYTQSQSLLDTLSIAQALAGGSGYLLSEMFSGQEYRIGEVAADFCQSLGNVVKTLDFQSSYPENVEMHGRWMQKAKEGDAWAWMSNVVYGLPDFEVSLGDYLKHDYRLVLSWSRDSLRNWEPGSLPEKQDYYRICSPAKESPVCISVDTVRIVSVAPGLFELQPRVSCENQSSGLSGRWMKAPAGTGQWEWIGDAAAGPVKLGVEETDLGSFDYRYMTTWTAELLNDDVKQERKFYIAEDTVQSIPVYRPGLENVKVSCVAGRDSNEVVVSYTCAEKITSLTYRIGAGEPETSPVVSQQDFVFRIPADDTFTLLAYAQEGLCDSILLEEKVDLVYKTRPQISKMQDVFACLGNEVRIAPEVSGKGELRIHWFKGNEEMPFSDRDTLRMNLTEPDTLNIRLSVVGEEVCPAEKDVFVVVADYPELLGDAEVRQICTGEPFRIGYQLTTADQYRVTLKASTMPGFSLFSGMLDVKEKENGELEIFSGQSILYATEFMAGHRFTFDIRLYRDVEFNGVTYRCENDREFVFEVKQKPVSRYVGDIFACINEEVVLNPEVESSGNRVSGYTWRLWNGDSLRVEKILVQSETETGLTAVVEKDWLGKRLQLVVDCECGEIVVQDILLNVFDNSSNVIVAPEGLAFTGESVRIAGSELGIGGIGYQWEAKTGNGDWEVLAGETEKQIELLVPKTETSYRRQIVSEVYDCEVKASNAVVLKVYNNEIENRIYSETADTLVSKGSTVKIAGTGAEREDVNFVWQKNDAGQWVDVETETAARLDLTVENMTLVRRKAVAGEKEMFSNVLLVNVYDVENNKIMAPLSILLPGEQARIIGNYFNIAGVEYSWWVNPESTGEWRRIEGAESWNLNPDLQESAMYMREVHLPTDTILKSNVLRLTVFDNKRDNVIHCDRLNVCKGGMIAVTGKEIGNTETVYRWEFSEDEGVSWEVIDGETAASLNYKAENSGLLRRWVVAEKLDNSFSNELFVNVVHAIEDNVIAFAGIVLAGQEAEIKGNEVKNAVYSWEKSENGKDNWQVIEGKEECSLLLGAEETTKECYFRRRLKFEDGGCEVVSEAVKMVIMDRQRNHITSLEKPVCQWSGFTLTGSDLEDVRAIYQWYCKRDGEWVACAYAFQKDLANYEGIADDMSYRRDAVVDGQVYESNIVNVTVWKSDRLENVVAPPDPVCAGSEVELLGSDLGTPEWKDYVKGYYWERSATAGGGTWEKVDSTGTQNLFLAKAEDPEWYCRVVVTYCGNALRSEPVLLEVKERLPLTLRHNASFGSMKPEEPVRISVDEDFYSSYEFRVNGETKPAESNEYLFYGWLPKKSYQIVANVVTSTGCTQTDTMQLHTSDVDLPNVLTPNNDGYNDVLLANYDLKVYNRWGNLLYSGTEGWDGKYKGRLVAAGTYFYLVKIKHVDGEVTEYKKSVTVKRD